MAKKVKILLVEDTGSLLELYKTRFLLDNYEVLTAANGKEAIAIAKESEPNLYIVDIMLPDINGLKVIEILKKLPENSNSGFIVLTALELQEKKQEAEELGVDAFLVKSQITLEDITRTAHEVLKKRNII